jgi:hypothetical protein
MSGEYKDYHEYINKKTEKCTNLSNSNPQMGLIESMHFQVSAPPLDNDKEFCGLCQSTISKKTSSNDVEEKKIAMITFECHTVHMKCIKKKNYDHLLKNDLCPVCHDFDKDFTMENLSKTMSQLTERVKGFNFEKNKTVITRGTRMFLIKSSFKSFSSILNVMKQSEWQNLLKTSNVSMQNFIDNNIHIQAIYKICGLTTLQDLKNIGFNNKHLINKELIPIKDFCILYCQNFRLLNTNTEDPLTIENLLDLSPTPNDLKALQFTFKDLFKGSNLSAKQILLHDKFPGLEIEAWMTDFDLDQNQFQALKLTNKDLKYLRWKEKDLLKYNLINK